jgi:rhodanese-related sulfurtransferase
MPSQVPEIEAAGVPAGAYLLDVREPVEWAAGHAESAVHIPMNDVPTRLGEVPEDAEIYVICKSGGRSAQVTAYLAQNGRRATNVAGGTLAWAAAGKQMVSENGADPHVH